MKTAQLINIKYKVSALLSPVRGATVSLQVRGKGRPLTNRVF